ncbi:MAG: hypothetical protein COV55_00430 [Candidatus Komeilibacteria bacterium CG11_big_fil_rev_8_21_14_0_20_36_20]|uniref:Uncharacterized protein n=1 Tax=Candidatus Komeilibacteria bacterium CG11_big_fil_rev_8_21_14_0_20_36_20 TaxID=1974477 RepID=A0A2H0NE96_9BACT|nr:MAG: hypothetical protein COV55_00430 [Candidatus Komeilibacteria bacterium CG11_big_fil_rev_8_21_14_0_20_36_20]PIR81649.1 MAG: hypothetical protein COU21_02285 [Candidatus Komeilibacteria bacterium CG10_big_fil_rev_8_21_14_0_10_36_65]
MSVLAFMMLSYFLINNFSISILFSNYGSTLPNIGELFKTIWIILKSVGIFMWLPSSLGFYYLYKNNREYFYLFLSLILIFILYISSWYRNGMFDIERYSICIIIILLLVSVCTVKIGKIWSIIFTTLFIISLIIVIRGLKKPVNFYQTYASVNNILLDYQLKSSQVAQHKLIDGDVQTYNDLAKIIRNNEVVFYWKNDWAIPGLILAGDHLETPAKLVAIDSEETLRKELVKYADHKVYLLRGVYDTYLSMGNKYKILENILVKERSLVYFISPDS